MIKDDGQLFHIDFGKALGHWQKFAGFSRDRVPFVFPKEFAFVIDRGESWEKTEKTKGLDPLFSEFILLCCKAFNVIRRNAHIFINLFLLMLNTGITELSSEKDIMYLKESLCLDLTEDEASEFFTKLIFKSLNSKSTSLNFFVHNVAKKGKR